MVPPPPSPPATLFWQTGAAGDPWWERRPKLRGVNVGGWLVLAPWINTALFRAHPPAAAAGGGVPAADAADSEFALCRRLGAVAAAAVLGAHRRDWLGAADFRAMAAAGLNAVRLPVGYWGVLPPRARGGPRRRPTAAVDPYVGPVWAHLDAALGWAAAARLGVLLDLHAHPGGQSGEAHSGRARGRAWTAEDWDVETALDAVTALAGRYGGAASADGSSSTATPPALLGLSVVNEPDEAIPPDVLLAFYRRAYAAARAGGLRAETVAFVVDGNPFRPDRLAAGGYVARATGLRGDNLVLDVHAYQCFGEGWAAASVADILRTWARAADGSGGSGAGERVAELAAAGRTHDRWVVVGEWSLRLPWAGAGVAAELASARAPAAAAAAAARAFGEAQVRGMAAAGVEGWFFWTWKVDACAAEPWWDFRECLRRGWLDPAWWGPDAGVG